MKIIEEKNKKFIAHVDTTDLTKILDMNFSRMSGSNGETVSCLRHLCQVCPTCYCYGIEETIDISLKKAKKTKMLYSATSSTLPRWQAAHNFRPERHVRLKYRYYHKHRGFVEAYEEALCVGCGRCGEACLAEITVPEVISSVREKRAEMDTRLEFVDILKEQDRRSPPPAGPQHV